MYLEVDMFFPPQPWFEKTKILDFIDWFECLVHGMGARNTCWVG